MRISDWSSDVCSSDLPDSPQVEDGPRPLQGLYLDPEAQRLPVAAYDDHAPAEYADRDPDSQPADARAVRLWAGRALGVQAGRPRPEERRVGEEWVSTVRSRRAPAKEKKKSRECMCMSSVA